MIDPLKQKVHRQTALTEFLRLRRTGFQDWFANLMTECYPDDFLRVRLSQGDGGLDGYRVSTKTVFQVFAPRDYTGKEMANKMTGDFATAVDTLAEQDLEMAEWVFVHNDPDDFPPEAIVAFAKLKEDNTGIEFRRWEFTAIWTELEKLTESKLDQLFGAAPTLAHLESLQYPQIIPVIERLVAEDAPTLPPIDLPDLEKLAYNQLPSDSAHLIELGRHKTGVVEAYLSEIPNEDRPEDIAEAYRKKYRDLADSGITVDEIFNALWVFSGGEHFSGKPNGIAAVTAVMAYFFDRCDIFENTTQSQ